MFEVSDVNGLRGFSEAGEEAVVAPGHVVVEHRTPEPQVVGQGPGVRELSRQNRRLASPEHKKLKQQLVIVTT